MKGKFTTTFAKTSLLIFVKQNVSWSFLAYCTERERERYAILDLSSRSLSLESTHIWFELCLHHL